MVLFKCPLCHQPLPAEKALHSTMVLFKLQNAGWALKAALTLHSTMVLFKSGSPHIPSALLLLYIPLWFYSNLRLVSQFIQTKCLYIPLWFYSNHQRLITATEIQDFTFHYGSIQIGTDYIKGLSYCIFTFHYGSIQIRPY